MTEFRSTVKRFLKPIYLRIRNRPIKNVFQTSNKKRVLISYIPYAFREKQNWYKHSNYQESHKIAEIFHEMGYVVDIFSQDDKRFIDYSQYSVIFGVGYPLENSFYDFDHKIIRIYYGLGTQMNVHNSLSIKRLRNFYDHHGSLLVSSGRIGNESWPLQTSFSDAIVTVGNDFTINSYRHNFKGKIFQIPVSFNDIWNSEDIINKRSPDSKKHYLWFGGSGMIHKGVDLLLDYFLKDSTIHLHVCGPMKKEHEFFHFYEEKIKKSKNIHLYGYLNVNSTQFSDLLSMCSFVVSPSIAEGQSSALVTTMALGGLIPIHTHRSGILQSNLSIIIDRASLSGIEKAIKKSKKMSYKTIQKHQVEIASKARKSYSIVQYSSLLKHSLNKILKEE